MARLIQEILRDAFAKKAKASAARATILTPERIVFEVLADAMATLKALPDPEAGWMFLQSCWPEIVHDYHDAIDNYRDMVRRILSGEESPDVLACRRVPSSPDIERMEAIFDVFPKCLVGQDRSRDWKILCLLAEGKTTKFVGRLVHASPTTVRNRRDLQCPQIARKLKDLMPPASPAPPTDRPRRPMSAEDERFFDGLAAA